jgi:aminopeptidase N
MSYYVGRKILCDAMKDYFTRFAFKNTSLQDFIVCLETAAAAEAKEDLKISEWANTWLTTAGANTLEVDFSGINYETGQGSIKVKQGYPSVGDKIYHSQALKLWLVNKKEDGTLEEVEQHYMLKAEEETVIMENCENMRPVAALVNSGAQGYCRVVFDERSIEYFLANVSSIKSQADRTYIWQTLYDHVRLIKVSPAKYVKCVIDHVSSETEQRTLAMIIGQTSSAVNTLLEAEERDALTNALFEVLLKHCMNQQEQSLRNLLVGNFLDFATTKE